MISLKKYYWTVDKIITIKQFIGIDKKLRFLLWYMTQQISKVVRILEEKNLFILLYIIILLNK